MSEINPAEAKRVSEPPLAVSTEDIQAQPRRTGHSLADLIISVSAIILSVVSLFVAIQNAWTQREMVSASTWPFVGGWVKIETAKQSLLQFGLSNSGVGPAKVHSFEVIYKGQSVRSTRDLMRRCCGLPTDPKKADAILNPRMSSTMVNGVILRSGEDQTAFAYLPDPANPALGQRFAQALRELQFRSCYCSVLDECWESNNSMTPTRVKSCKEPEHPFEADGP
jgi:hypothetical protein